MSATRRYAGFTTAVVATDDDSGSTGRLRESMEMPAPGDVRRCLTAIAGAESDPLGQAFEYRFGGTDVEGHALGNLVLAGLAAVTGDFAAATGEAGRLLGLDPSDGQVMPASVEPVGMYATTHDGGVVHGQYAISKTEGIRRVGLEPAGVAAPGGIAEAVISADQVVLGPGSVYTSILAAALVEEVRAALEQTRARRIFVCNLEPEPAETLGYDVAAHVAALRAHGVVPDVVLVATRTDGPTLPIGAVDSAVEVVSADLLTPDGTAHDCRKLATALAELVA